MGYIIENKQDTAAQSVLLTTEKSFVASSGIDKSNNTQYKQYYWIQKRMIY